MELPYALSKENQTHLMNYRYLLIAGILGLFLWGCQHFDDLNNVEPVGNDAEYAIPLINTSVSLDDLLENLDKYTYLDIDTNQLIYLGTKEMSSRKRARRSSRISNWRCRHSSPWSIR